MATKINNASNQVFSNNSDGFTLGGGTTERDLAISGANITVVGSGTNIFTFPTVTCNLLGSLQAIAFNYVSKISAYTITLTDCFVGYNQTGAVIATLPNATTTAFGQIFIVKDESGSAGGGTNTITVKTNGGTIDGSPSGTGKIISTNYGVLRIYSNQTNYFTF